MPSGKLASDAATPGASPVSGSGRAGVTALVTVAVANVVLWVVARPAGQPGGRFAGEPCGEPKRPPIRAPRHSVWAARAAAPQPVVRSTASRSIAPSKDIAPPGAAAVLVVASSIPPFAAKIHTLQAHERRAPKENTVSASLASRPQPAVLSAIGGRWLPTQNDEELLSVSRPASSFTPRIAARAQRASRSPARCWVCITAAANA